MAIYHLHAQIIGRAEGRNAVASAAYRHCARMEIEREARVVDYSNKKGLAHSEFALPNETPAWLRTLIDGRDAAGASAAFWNRVEAFERRSDAQLMREMDLALPTELSREQNIELVRAFVSEQVTARGMVADWAYHDVAGNPHVHLMTTLRPLTEDGFGAKRVAATGADGRVIRVKSLSHPGGKIVYRLWAGDEGMLAEWREAWAAIQNAHLSRLGLDTRVDHRSFAERGIELEPTVKLGVGVKHILAKSGDEGWASELDRLRLFEATRAASAERIVRRPEIILEMIARERSVFDERDLAKLVHRYIDDASAFGAVMAKLNASPEIVRLQSAGFDLDRGAVALPKLATRTMIRTEAKMVEQAINLAGQDGFGVSARTLSAILEEFSWLNEEQKAAVEYVTSSSSIAAVVGLAGAGKTTALRAARRAWEREGHRVVGGALAGKAAEGLEQEAGIKSRTLSSWELAWKQDRELPDNKTIFVMDEAGMVASDQMSRFVEQLVRTGGKLVLVGDGEQLQPIEAGAAFRAIHDRIGYVVLANVRRQQMNWMRHASVDFARGRVAEAIAAYGRHGKVLPSPTKREAMQTLIADWNRDHASEKSSLILAHLRRDVRMLNEMARDKLIERGILDQGHRFETEDGVRLFAAGDQVVFLRNESSLGVKNGMIGRVLDATPGKVTVGIRDRRVEVAQAFYRNIDYGYATTVHKSQGATVDQVKVLASLSLDKHLTYVAMTRHREDAALYFGERSFAKAGGLVPLLSRRQAKETTLDYVGSADYGAALRYAKTRGLHAVRVARSLLGEQVRAVKSGKARLMELSHRLMAVAARLRLPAINHPPVLKSSRQVYAAGASGAPALGRVRANGAGATRDVIAVPAVTGWRQSIPVTVEEKLMADEALRAQWRFVSKTFARIYRDPHDAAVGMNIGALIDAPGANRAVLDRLSGDPSAFGQLKGKVGLLASNAEKEQRRLAMKGGAMLRQQIESYAAAKARAAGALEAAERESRRRAAIDIPALSEAAGAVIERARDAIDRNDLPAARAFVLADRLAKIEIDRVGSAAAERFGPRALLGADANSIDGPAFKAARKGLSSDQALKLAEGWPALRTIQQLAAYERKVETVRQAEGARPAMRPALKAGL